MNTLPRGTRVGPYEVLGPIGAGGMGEVYRARDARLARDVAIKVLPPSVALDEDRLRRFEREARILASLDHPHIAGIYGVEAVGGSQALVLELVEGPTLAERISRGRLDLAETLTIARQIADAVESAHEQGVIHRDLKPANIKVRSDGTVKVLDFGLARADRTESGDAREAPTITAATREGTTLGTPAYMSPEQARGRHVDKRTDVWAFGCVLYEMLTGRRAFAADTTTDTLAIVLQRDPDWHALPADTPRAIRDLVTRCLQKDLRRRLRDVGDARLIIEDALAGPVGADATPSSARLLLPSPVVLLAVAIGAATVTYGATWLSSGAAADTDWPFDRMTRLVASAAHEFSPAISPDGNWVAYLSNARGPTDIWLKSVGSGDPVNLTATLDLQVQDSDTIGGIDISPDGTTLAFVSAVPGQQAARAATWVLPVPLGGAPRQLIQGVQGLRWSPDGSQLTYMKPGGARGDSLHVADVDGQNERELVKRERARHIHWPRWSADGRYVYFNYGVQNGNAEQTEIYRVPAAGGPAESVVATARRAVYPLPGPDGRSLFFAANPDSADASLWKRDLATGRDERLTFGVGDYGSLSISADGRRLVATLSDLRQQLLRIAVRFDTAVVPEPLTEGYTGDVDPSWSPDGARIAFSSSRTGSRNIWWAKPDLSMPVPLTTGPHIDERPAFSPDGSQVAFVSDRGGRRGIWVVSADGGTPKHAGPADVLGPISWSPDGTRLVYAAPGEELPQIEMMELTSGNVSRLPTEFAANSPAWSPVEDVIAYVETVEGVGPFVRFMTGDGRAITRGPVDNVTSLSNGFVRWSPDGRKLVGVGVPGNRAAYVWIIDPLGPVPFRKLVDFPADVYPRGVTWSPDGSAIVIGHSRASGDIVLAERAR